MIALGNNRRKGFVLNEEFLDPRKWEYLEYVIAEKPTEQFPCLADSVIGFMKELPTWEGTATELIELIDSRDNNIPKDGRRLSMELLKPEVIKALESKDISVEKKRSASRRTLLLCNKSNVTV